MAENVKSLIQSIATDLVVKEIAFGKINFLLDKSFFNVNNLTKFFLKSFN